MHGLLDAGDGGLIHQFQGSREQAGRQDGIDRPGGILQGWEFDQCGADKTRFGDQTQQGFGDDAQRAFRAGKERLQIIADHILDALVAGVQDAPIRQDDSQAEHVVAGHAVFQAARAAGIGGDIPADGRLLDAGRVGRVEQAEFFHGRLQIGGNHSRFDGRSGVGFIDFQDMVHAGQRQDDSAPVGHRTACQARAHAARDHRELFPGSQLHNLADLFCGARQNDDLRAAFLESGVVAVDGQVFGRGEHAIFAGNLFKLGEQVFIHHYSFSLVVTTSVVTFSERLRSPVYCPGKSPLRYA